MLTEFVTILGAIALFVFALPYALDPRGAIAIGKKLFIVVVGMIMGLHLLEQWTAGLPAPSASTQSEGSPLVGFLILSGAAYLIREWRLRHAPDRRRDTGRIRAAERTPVLPHDLEDDA